MEPLIHKLFIALFFHFLLTVHRAAMHLQNNDKKEGQFIFSSRSSWTFLAIAIKSIIYHQCTGNDLYAHLQAGEDILREAI